jgi:Flp pilus assembly protein TadB
MSDSVQNGIPRGRKGRPNMNIKKLAASDFPGIDEAKFNEWKALRRKTNREYYIGACIFLAIIFILWLLAGFESHVSIIVLVFFLALNGFYSIRSKRVRQLKEDLKISERWQAKKEGRSFTE